jgi:UDP-glucose 4-epimerase
MKILFTGASSFTGYWMVHALAGAGHEVIAPLRGKEDGYSDAKALRVGLLPPVCELQFGVNFGDERFLELIESRGPFDVLCHHAAEVREYRSADFDAVGALVGNVHKLIAVLRKLKEKNCRKMILTGSVFEPDEGIGPAPRDAFSPYGLSKGLTWQYVRYYAGREGFTLGKFVIPNPIGPLEEPRFISYLMKNWLTGQTPAVKTPRYVRDNIHVDLLAAAYRRFVETLGETSAHFGPSGYVESMGEFANRVAGEMSKRLGRECKVKLEEQTDFSEPMTPVNMDPTSGAEFGWSESAAWDKLAEYYSPGSAQK